MLAPLLFPFLRVLPPETAHQLALAGLALGLGAAPAMPAASRLAVKLSGFTLVHPLGLAAGFDKNAGAVRGLLASGFSFVEAGTVTPLPQAGNAKPRLFRLSADRAVINRMGFNNKGLEAFARRLEALPPKGERPGPVGANVGANKNSDDRIADYAHGVRRLAPLADYLTLNISSPNTPGLRDLQSEEALARLLDAAFNAREHTDTSGHTTPIWVKIAPDIDPGALDRLAAVLERYPLGAVIATNTTTARPADLSSAAREEAGGLSGRPLAAMAARTTAQLYNRLGGRLPIVGTGGIATADDVWQRMRLGATALQLYTALVYEGPTLPARIIRAFDTRLQREGIDAAPQIIGQDAASFN